MKFLPLRSTFLNLASQWTNRRHRFLHYKNIFFPSDVSWNLKNKINCVSWLFFLHCLTIFILKTCNLQKPSVELAPIPLTRYAQVGLLLCYFSLVQKWTREGARVYITASIHHLSRIQLINSNKTSVHPEISLSITTYINPDIHLSRHQSTDRVAHPCKNHNYMITCHTKFGNRILSLGMSFAVSLYIM